MTCISTKSTQWHLDSLGREKPEARDENGALTFLAYFSFVAWHTDADSHDAGAVTEACWVDALLFWNVALWPLPAISADAVSFLVFSIPATQHRARIWRLANELIVFSESF